MSIQSVYDSYKHLGFMLEDPKFASDFKNTMLHNMWVAISEEARRPQLAIEPDVLLDTAVLLEDEADEEHITTAIVYRRRAAEFRVAAQQLTATPPTAATCCSCRRSFPVGNTSTICEHCYEDKEKRLKAASADAEAYRQMVDAIRVRNKELGTECETLRDALTAVQQAFAKGEAKFTKKRQSDSDPYHPANVKMTAALFSEDKGEGA